MGSNTEYRTHLEDESIRVARMGRRSIKCSSTARTTRVVAIDIRRLLMCFGNYTCQQDPVSLVLLHSGYTSSPLASYSCVLDAERCPSCICFQLEINRLATPFWSGSSRFASLPSPTLASKIYFERHERTFLFASSIHCDFVLVTRAARYPRRCDVDPPEV
jgi:hypothetical protein